MEAISILLAPFVVSATTTLFKVVVDLKGTYKKLIIRIIVALLSLILVALKGVLMDGEFDLISLKTAAETLINALGATGVYFLTSKKS